MARNSNKNESDRGESAEIYDPDIDDPDFAGADEIPYYQAIDLEDGEQIAGYYLGHDLAEGGHRTQQRHHFRTKDGEIRVIWGKTALDSQLGQADLGKYTLVRRSGVYLKSDGRPGKKIRYIVKQVGEIDRAGLIGRPALSDDRDDRDSRRARR